MWKRDKLAPGTQHILSKCQILSAPFNELSEGMGLKTRGFLRLHPVSFLCTILPPDGNQPQLAHLCTPLALSYLRVFEFPFNPWLTHSYPSVFSLKYPLHRMTSLWLESQLKQLSLSPFPHTLRILLISSIVLSIIWNILFFGQFTCLLLLTFLVLDTAFCN